MSAVKAHSASAVPLGKWSVDAERSTVAFSMKHMLLATVNGRFREFDGLLDIGTDAPRAFGAGGALLGNKVKIALEISAVKTDSP